MFTRVTRSMTPRLSFIGVLLKVNLEAMLKVTRVNIPQVKDNIKHAISMRVPQKSPSFVKSC